MLAPQYLNQSPTQRWVQLTVAAGKYRRAVEEVYAALAGSLIRCAPVYRRGEALDAVRFDVVVGRVVGKRGRSIQLLEELAQRLEVRLTVHGSGVIRLSSERPIALLDTVLPYLRKLEIDATLRYERVPLRSRNTLGSRPAERARPRPRPVVRPSIPNLPAPAPPSPHPVEGSSRWLRIKKFRSRAPTSEGSEPVPRTPMWHLAAIHAPTTNDIAAPTATTVVVAVIDDLCAVSNTDLGSIDLDNNHATMNDGVVFTGVGLSFGEPSDPPFPMPDPLRPVQSHGTACCGVIVARWDGLLPRGLAPRARVLPLCVYEWTDADGVDAIHRACFVRPERGDLPVRVLSMSLAWFPGECDDEFFGMLEEALYRAHMQGILIVASTGNVREVDNPDRGLGFPACLPYVMAIGAVGSPDGDAAALSHKEFGDDTGEGWAARYEDAVAPVPGNVMGQISVVAPGVGICTTDVWPNRLDDDDIDNDEYTETFNGTSAATPLVAGLAALLLEKTSALTAAQVRYIIEATADKVGDEAYAWRSPWDSSTRTPKLGYGCIHAQHALEFADVQLHDATRSRGFSPLSQGIGSAIVWASSDVLITEQKWTGPFESPPRTKPKWGAKFCVNVRIWNVGPMVAQRVEAQVWLIADPSLPWLLERKGDGEFVVTGPNTDGILLLGKASVQHDLSIGSTVVSIDARAPASDFNLSSAYLLVMVNAMNDHAFAKTLPARPTDVLPHNNLTRVRLRDLMSDL